MTDNIILMKDKKALLIQAKDPTVLQRAVPNVGFIDYAGRGVFGVVAHTDKNAIALQAVGINAPAPINHYYDWPGIYTPRHEQRMTASFLTMHQRGLVANDMGTGKTISSLWAADYLIRTGQAKTFLIVSPMSTLSFVWEAEIFKHFPQYKSKVLTGDKKRRLRRLNEPATFYIINHDGFKTPAMQEVLYNKFDVIIVDEASVYRNHKAQLFQKMNKFLLFHPNLRVWLMTGTPTPHEPTDAWALGKMLRNPDCPMTYYQFQDKVMRKQGPFKWVAKPNATEGAELIMKPSIRYTREECWDLPDTIYQSRDVPLTSDQTQLYDDMKKKFIAEIDEDETIIAKNEVSKRGKLLQICCGIIYDEFKDTKELDCRSRLQETRDVVTEMGGKTIVFVPFTGATDMLARELAKDWSVGKIYGKVKEKDRQEIFRNFQTQEHPQIIVAHPGTMAHGLTLTKASKIVWFGPPDSLDTYLQSNARIERPGKERTSLVVHMCGTELERKIYERLQNRQDLAGLLLEHLKRQTKEIL